MLSLTVGLYSFRECPCSPYVRVGLGLGLGYG